MSNTPRISVAAPKLSGKEQEYVADAISSTWISSRGPYLERFEAEVARMAGTKHAVACNNGTTSLHLALAALGVSEDDEVIMPALTYIATANCVKYCGGVPVLVDNDRGTFNIDPASIEKVITSKTKGIVVVHLYGQSADMDPILEVAERHGIWVLEDAAEAHGALYKNKPVGGLGICGSFSFFGNKIITTGEGGAVTTNDDALAEKMRFLRSQGMDPSRRYWHPEVGYNYRMTNVTAAIGVAQMERLSEALNTRRWIAETYERLLAGYAEHIILPYVASECEHSYWMYTIMLGEKSKVSRDEAMLKLEVMGIETRPIFYPLNQMPPYYDSLLDVPNAVFCGAQGINLPTHELLTEEDIERVCKSLIEVVAG